MQGHHQLPEKTSGSTRDGGPASSALLDAPYQVATDAAGDLYIADANNNRVREVAAGNGTQWGPSMTAGDICTVAGTTTVSAGPESSQRCLRQFASAPLQGPSRAPQNLCPIVGLERELRRRLDDPKVLYRALREAARPARRVPHSCPGQPGKTLADANNPLTPHGLSGPLRRSRF
jgi:hypothetical protein